MSDPLPITDTLTLPGDLLTFEASRAPGPGGQHVNKAATKVTLRFDLPACTTLDEGTRARLRARCRRRLDREGRIVIVASRHRSQARNLEDARARLRDLVLEALTPPKPHRKTRPSRAARRRRIEAKRRRSATKAARRPPKPE